MTFTKVLISSTSKAYQTKLKCYELRIVKYKLKYLQPSRTIEITQKILHKFDKKQTVFKKTLGFLILY